MRSKLSRPFSVWCIDLITKLRPIGPGGEQYVIVAIDPFTKWVELGALAERSSAAVAGWVDFNLVSRYGVPAIIRCDRGTEFAGTFTRYCRAMGIRVTPVAVAHPRANG